MTTATDFGLIPPGDPHADGWRRLGRADPLWVGIALSLLLHVFLLWWLPAQQPLRMEAHSGASAPMAIRLAPRQPVQRQPQPAPAEPTPAQSAPPPRPTPRPAPRPTPSPAPRIIAVPAPNAPAPADRTRVAPADPRPLPPLPPLPPDTPASNAPADDMFGQLQARRAERNAPAGASSAAPERSANEIANENARRNLAGITGRGPDPVDQTGGVFQVTRVTSREAEFLFRGWNSNFKRNWSETVTVPVGNAPDINTAVARKMIEIIRRYEKGDFTWESHRLGKTLQLSARPQDQADLERFLMAEFFSAR